MCPSRSKSRPSAARGVRRRPRKSGRARSSLNTSRGRSKRKSPDVGPAPRLSLWIRAPWLLRGAAGLRARAAAGLRPTSTTRRRAPDASINRGACAPSATVGRPHARTARKRRHRPGLLLDPGRGAESEGVSGCSRDVAVGHGRGEARYETIRGGRGTAVARAPRSAARVAPTSTSRHRARCYEYTSEVVRR